MLRELNVACVLVAHWPLKVLAPATYGVGTSDRKKANATRLWQEHGPFAARTYAAALYQNSIGYIPNTWDWLERTPVPFG